MAHQLEALAADGAADLCFGAARQLYHGLPDDGGGAVRRGLTRTTMLLRREVFERVGPMIDPPGMRGELIDWLARAREAGFRMIELTDVLALRRVLRGSLSWGRDPERDRGYLAVAHRALMARRRKERGE